MSKRPAKPVIGPTREPAARLQARRVGYGLPRAAPPAEAPKPWCLYVLRCADGSLYCGITNDLARRFHQHSQGTGARYTRGRSPLTLLRTWPMENKSTALKAELAFKSLSRRDKEARLAMP